MTPGARAAYIRLGRLMLAEVGAKVCLDAYQTKDPILVGRIALGYGDINPDGSFN